MARLRRVRGVVATRKKKVRFYKCAPMLSSYELALKLSRQRTIRPCIRFSSESTKPKSKPKLKCPCGAHSEPTKSTQFNWCEKCRIFVSVGGLVRCVCGLAMPPNDNAEDENGANDEHDDDDDALIDWIQCDRCKHFLHMDCVFGAHASSAELAEQKFICVLCDDENNKNDREIVEKVNSTVTVDENRPANVVANHDAEAAPNRPRRRARRYYVCNMDGCDYFSRDNKVIQLHRQWGHPDRVGDKETVPLKVFAEFRPLATCRCCGIKQSTLNGNYRRHFDQCIKKNPIRTTTDAPPVQVERQSVSDVAETPQPEQPRKRTRTSASAKIVNKEATVTAFPPSAVRVIGSAASVALEKARRGVLLRKIRAVIELDEAFLQTMNAKYASHKLSNEVNEQL